MKESFLNDQFFSRLETLSLNLRSNLAGYFGGQHLVTTYGQTVEFADFREYQLGDDIRRIDWNLYSRFEKYFLKLFTDERQMQVQIFLDCSEIFWTLQNSGILYINVSLSTSKAKYFPSGLKVKSLPSIENISLNSGTVKTLI